MLFSKASQYRNDKSDKPQTRLMNHILCAVLNCMFNPFMPGDRLDQCRLDPSYFETNFGMKHKFAKYLKERCRKSSGEQSSFKCFLNIAFIREISLKLSGGFGCYRHEWVKHAKNLDGCEEI